MSSIKIRKSSFIRGNKSFKILMFGDLHYSKNYSIKKLKKLKKVVACSNPDYLIIAGDLIDSTNFIYSHSSKEILLDWIQELAQICIVLIVLGNHDICYYQSKLLSDFNSAFWKEINKIKNVYVSHYNKFYQDDSVNIYLHEEGLDYYKNSIENKDILIANLKKANFNISKDKVNILVIHSPILLSDSLVSSLIGDFDFIFSGHMHNGMIPYPFDKIKGNTGIIAPDKSLFPDNARGTKDINVGDKDIHLIINGGITKLSECTNVLSKFNNIYKMNIDEIEINSKVKKLVK